MSKKIVQYKLVQSELKIDGKVIPSVVSMKETYYSFCKPTVELDFSFDREYMEKLNESYRNE